jgi:hypothetical protein
MKTVILLIRYNGQIEVYKSLKALVKNNPQFVESTIYYNWKQNGVYVARNGVKIVKKTINR